MKKILLGLFLICNLSCFCQEKKDSKIIVTVSDTSNLFKRVALALIDKGYSFENKDQQLSFIATTDKKIPKTMGSMKIRSIVKGNTVTFTGVWATNGDLSLFGGGKGEKTFAPVVYSGGSNSINRLCWAEMESIAKQFGTITYSK